MYIKYLLLLLYGTSYVLSEESGKENGTEDKVGDEGQREAKQMWPFLASYYIQNGQSRAHVGSLQAHLPRAVIQPPPILSASGLFSKYTQQAPKAQAPGRRPWQFRSALISSSLTSGASGEDDKSKKLFSKIKH